MSNATHTPARWATWGDAQMQSLGVTGATAAAAMGATIAIREQGYAFFEEVLSFDQSVVAIVLGKPSEEAKERARLIAAAPELLAALILMVRTHDEPAETLLQEAKEQQWLWQARSAIAKATGGAA